MVGFSIGWWWRCYGERDFPHATELAVVVDLPARDRFERWERVLIALADDLNIPIRVWRRLPAYMNKATASRRLFSDSTRQLRKRQQRGRSAAVDLIIPPRAAEEKVDFPVDEPYATDSSAQGMTGS